MDRPSDATCMAIETRTRVDAKLRKYFSDFTLPQEDDLEDALHHEFLNGESTQYDVSGFHSQDRRIQAEAAIVFYLVSAARSAAHLEQELRGDHNRSADIVSLISCLSMQSRDYLATADMLLLSSAIEIGREKSRAARASGGKARAVLSETEWARVVEIREEYYRSLKVSRKQAGTRIAEMLAKGKLPGIPRQVNLKAETIARHPKTKN